MRRLLLLALLLAPVARAETPPVYGIFVDLVQERYLHPEEVRASDLLKAAAGGLSDELHWLMVEEDLRGVSLSHGDGTPIGRVEVGSIDRLDDALFELEELVLGADGELGDLDVRLAVLDGAATGLDRYSRVLAGEKLERFDVRIRGTLVGVGATLRMVDDALKIVEVEAEGPAAEAGLHDGDLLLRIDGRSTLNMPVREAIRLIRGEEGSTVELEVQRGVDILALPVVRREIIVQNVQHAVLEDDVGYIRIDHVSQKTVYNLRKALQFLREAEALGVGLVLDLRGNTGGSMKEAARAADQFLTEGMLLRTAGRDGQPVAGLEARMDAVDAGDEPPIPVVVLVDDRTASGAEILAGALLQHGRAALVGTRTYGKGQVQKIYTLDQGQDIRMKLTVAEYLLLGDVRVARDGIAPDVELSGIRLDEDGMRYDGATPWRTDAPWDQVVPAVVEGSGWRGGPGDARDVSLELARRAVLAADGADREAALAGLRAVVPQVRATQLAHLEEALAGKGLDWSPAPRAVDAAPPLSVVLRAEPLVPGEDSLTVEATVTNAGSEPLYRVQIDLGCETFSALDGVAFPVGRIEPGESLRATARLPLRPGVNLREDLVEVHAFADRRPSARLDDTVVTIQSAHLPSLRVAARLDGEGAERKALVTVRNLGAEEVEGVEVFFTWPGDVGVELVDQASRIPHLLPREESTVALAVRVEEGAPEVLPLELIIEAARFGRVADWTLPLPVDGGTVQLEAPRILARAHELSAPAGRYIFPLQISDDGQIDHAVVLVNGEKEVWAGGGRPRLDLRAAFDVGPGSNRVEVLVEDDQGLSSRRVFYVRGDAPAAADAAVEPLPED